jgi:hypothetical protein
MTTSREHAWRAARALEVYLERGRRALASLEQGDADAAATLLAKRSAAFHNFRALDALAREAGEDVVALPSVLQIYLAVKELEPKLAAAVEAARDRALEQYRNVRATRRKLNQGYGPNVAEGDSRFVHSV